MNQSLRWEHCFVFIWTLTYWCFSFGQWPIRKLKFDEGKRSKQNSTGFLRVRIFEKWHLLPWILFFFSILQDLPEDMIVSILAFLHYKDILFILPQVNRYLYFFVESPKLWQLLYIRSLFGINREEQNDKLDWKTKFLTTVPKFYPTGLVARLKTSFKISNMNACLISYSDIALLQSSATLSTFKLPNCKCVYYEVYCKRIKKACIGFSGISKPYTSNQLNR